MGAWEKLALELCSGDTHKKFTEIRSALAAEKSRAVNAAEVTRSRSVQSAADKYEKDVTLAALLALRDTLDEELSDNGRTSR